MKLRLIAVIFCLSTFTSAPAAETVTTATSLKNAPANTWVKILSAQTGKREQPVFVYATKLKRFIAATGMQHYNGARPRHYDTEEFDLNTAKWINAYPAGLEKGRPLSGPVGQEYSKQRAKHGHSGRVLFYKDGPHTRLGAGGQWHNGKTYGEYCYVPEGGQSGKVYVYMWGKYTLCYDVAQRTWSDLKAEPRTKCRLWGAMCYDPLNKEILHAGGDCGSADLSTWAYDIAGNKWRQLELGSAQLKKLWSQSKSLRWQAKTLLGRCSSRHQVAETDAEAKIKLPGQAVKLVMSAGKLLAEVQKAKLPANEKTGGEVAARRLNSAIAAINSVSKSLSGQITPETIAKVRKAREIFESVVDALSPEPPGRARSPIAYDPINKKIILFGGDGLDRVLSDTWVYDCKTRSWQQKFPEVCPPPRAGHILAYLNKGRKIVLAGGYSRLPLPQDIWSYDLASNKWQLLKHVPLSNTRRPASPGCPAVNRFLPLAGAVTDDDVLVCANGNDVWACRIDPSKADLAKTTAVGVKSGSYVFNPISPAVWESAANPTPEATSKFINNLPVNQWTAYQFPRYAPGARNRWGTTAYDTDRHQLLLWGGGHATSHENDVAHFSLLGGFWSIGFHPDDPIERVYAVQPTFLSFNDRVHVPIHAYRAYCYDPTAKQMFYGNRGYDPLVREWAPAPYPGLSWRGPMHSQMENTPQGAVTLSTKGLFRFNAKTSKWDKLPWEGEKAMSMWCDGSTLCYDSKRNCLWLAGRKKIVRYNIADGRAKKVAVSKPKALGTWHLWSEQVYLPESDLLLLMRLFKKPDGSMSNLAWSPETGKYYWVKLSFSEKSKEVVFKKNTFSWHDALHYDTKLKLLVLNNSGARKVWILKFDSKTAQQEEIIEK
jgi:Galactose oxidase, central domain